MTNNTRFLSIKFRLLAVALLLLISAMHNLVAQPVLSVEPVSVAEGESNRSAQVDFVITLSEQVASDVSVDYVTQDGTADSGSDYRRVANTLILSAGNTSGRVTVDIPFDIENVEPTEHFRLVLSNPINATFPGSSLTYSATCVILDNDGAVDDTPIPIVRGGVVLEEGGLPGGGGQAEFRLVLSHALQVDLLYSYSTIDGSAKGGVDYTPTSGTLLLRRGERSAAVTVPITADSLVERNEDFYLTFTPEENSLAQAPRGGRCVIHDNDDIGASRPVLSAESQYAAEARSNQSSTMDFLVTLSSPSAAEVTVDYVTEDGTADSGSDYVRKAGTLRLAPGNTSGRVTVDIPFDIENSERAENFRLVLCNPINAIFPRAATTHVATCIIRDNDGFTDTRPVVFVQDGGALEDTFGVSGGGIAEFQLMVSAPLEGRTQFSYSTADGTAEGGIDFVPTAGCRLLPQGACRALLTVPIASDSDIEGNEDFFLMLKPSQDVFGTSRMSGRCVILDEDAQSLSNPVLSSSSVNVSEARSNLSSTMDFVVTLSKPVASEVMVDYVTQDGSANSGSDYQRAEGTLVLSPGETAGIITVQIPFDVQNVEPVEEFRLLLSNPRNAALPGAAVSFASTCTIYDNDGTSALPILRFADPPDVVDGGDKFVITFDLLVFTRLLDLNLPAAEMIPFTYSVLSNTVDSVETVASSAIQAGTSHTEFVVEVDKDELAGGRNAIVILVSDVDGAEFDSGSDTLFSMSCLNTALPPLMAGTQISLDSEEENSVTVSFQTETGKTYVVQSSGDLNCWSNVSTMVGTGGGMTYSSVVSDRSFLRIWQVPD